MNKSDELIKKFQDFAQNDEFWEEIEKRESRRIEFYERYVKKIMSLPKKKREELIQKIINKYDSDEYVKREYRLGYQPRETLFSIIYYWAANYGQEIENEDENDYFPVERYIVDDNIKVVAIYGQGTKINVSIIH